jgi:ABC-type nitrate/sulfonate/bicarbonate transport system substrate-binding protein
MPGGILAMKKKISILAGVLMFAFLSTVGAQEKIRIGIGSVSLQSVLPFIGKQRGIFARYNLVPEIVYIPGGSTNVQALIFHSSPAHREPRPISRAPTLSTFSACWIS